MAGGVPSRWAEANYIPQLGFPPSGRWGFPSDDMPMSTNELLLTLLLIPIGIWVLKGLLVIRGKRQMVRGRLRAMVLGLVAAGISWVVVAATGSRSGSVEQALIPAAIGIAVYSLQQPRQSRYIPKGIKKAVVRRFEERTGEKFDPKLHDVDHVVPYSRGGGHTEDNLRVQPKRKNRSRGNQQPKLRDFFD